MPRRREVPKREILPDPKFGNTDVAKFVNVLMLSGKKSVAENIIYGAFEYIQTKSGKDPLEVFSTAIALYLYYEILGTMGSMAAASQSYLRIVFGVAIGIVFLGEHLTWERFAGILLILFGVMAMTRPVQGMAMLSRRRSGRG